MKIDVTEDQARRLRQQIRGSGDLKDVDLKLASALDNAARNPMLTADELGAVLAQVRGWLESVPAVALGDRGDRHRLLTAAKPKLEAMAKRAGAVEDVRKRTPGMDVDPDVIP